MVAGWDLGWYPGGVDVFLTHWTVGSGDPLHTLVSSLQMIGQTHVTSVTVEIIATSTNLGREIVQTIYVSNIQINEIKSDVLFMSKCTV